jgi:hypothetical protein
VDQASTYVLEESVGVGMDQCAVDVQKSDVLARLVLYRNGQRVLLSVHNIYKANENKD